MDWFERIFHVDPDNGNGMFELAILIFIALAIVMTVVSVRRRAAARRSGNK